MPICSICNIQIKNMYKHKKTKKHLDNASHNDKYYNTLKKDLHDLISEIDGLKQLINDLLRNKDELEMMQEDLSNCVNDLIEERKNFVICKKIINNLEAVEHKSKSTKTCSICLSDIYKHQTIIKLKCFHIFHYQCLARSIINNNITCPLCRGDICKINHNHCTCHVDSNIE